MDMLYTVLLADLSMVLVCYAILLLAFASNVVLSLYHNINITGEHFDAKRLWQGVKKALVLVIGTMLMVTAVDAATTLLTQYVPDINEQVHDLITVAMIAATIGVAAWRYLPHPYPQTGSRTSPVLQGSGRWLRKRLSLLSFLLRRP